MEERLTTQFSDAGLTTQSNLVVEEGSVAPAESTEESEVPAATYVEEGTAVQSNPVAEEGSVAPAESVDESLETLGNAVVEESLATQSNPVAEEEQAVPAAAVTDESEAEDVIPRTDITGSVAVSDDATVGGGVRVGNNSLFKRDVTVEGWLDAPNIRGKLRKWIEDIESAAKRAQDTADEALEGGGGSGGGGFDTEQILSAIKAYGDRLFLSKLKDDRARGRIASDLGFEIGDYLAGVSGGMFGMSRETGDSFAEVRDLYVRGKAYFETLNIIDAKTLAGKQYITPGGGIKCTKVEEVKDAAGITTAYRCYFLAEQDGEKTETKIVAGDQVISEMFNAKEGTVNKVSNHRYWRLVTGVSNSAYTDDAGKRYCYIDLSKDDCEAGSDVPKEGDVIDQLGNRKDRTRQAAMVFSTVDADAPSIKMFTGIGSGETNAEHYTLAERDIISQGYDAENGEAYFNVYGRAYIGDKGGSTYMKYDPEKKELDIKARLNLSSTVGDKTLEDIAADAEQGSVTVQILTDRGNVLLNGEGQRVLTAYVKFRNEDVTERIYSGRFSWKRTSDDETGDRIWARLHEGIGNRCTVTDEDVDRNAIFECEVDLSGTWLDTETNQE